MRILYSLPHPHDRLEDERAGHIVRANALLGAMERAGHQVTRVQAADMVGSRRTVTVYRKVIRPFLPRFIALPLRDLGRFFSNLRYGRRLVATARQVRPDIILETHVAFAVSGAVAAGKCNVPLALDDVATPESEARFYPVGCLALARATYRYAVRRADLVIAVTDRIRQDLIGLGISAERVLALPNGAPERTGSPAAAAQGRATAPITIGFLGSFQSYHDLPLLLRALARVPGSVRLMLIGDGPTLEECRHIAAGTGLADRVTFLGRLTNAEAVCHLANFDIAVLPATTAYGNAMKLYEYMAAGCAIVAPDDAEVRAVVGAAAVLFPEGDVDGLAAALRRLAGDAGERRRLGDLAREAVQGQGWSARAEALLKAMATIGAAAPSIVPVSLT